jgi:zinc/manganese transport system substrate-binding protein
MLPLFAPPAKILPALACLAALLGAAAPAHAKPKIVATTETLAALAREVGGDRVEVVSLTRGTQDPHRLEPRPELLVQLAKADVLFLVGLELEIGWLPRLIDGANNPAIRPGGVGYVDASTYVPIKEKPTGPVDRSQGDVHPLGNPHHWLDPVNGARIAKGLAARLATLDPDGRASYDAAFKAFAGRLREKIAAWEGSLKPKRGAAIVAFHRSWTYLLDWLGLVNVGYIEPRPGVPPSPSHLAALGATMKDKGVKVLIIEPFFDATAARELSSSVGAKVVVLPQSVGGSAQATSYLGLIDAIVTSLGQAL